MKNRILLVFLAAILVVSLVALAACAKEEEAPPVEEEEEEAPPVEEVWEWPEKMNILSQTAGSLAYGVAIAWTTPLAEDTGMKIRLVCEDNEMLRWKWMKENRFFTKGLSVEPKEFLEVNEDRATRDGGPYQIRIWWPLGKGGFGFAVRGDSDIKTPYDIKPGTKFIHLTFVPGGKVPMEALAAWGQIDPEDIVWVPAGSVEAWSGFLMEGKGDIAMAFPASPVWYEAEAGPRGLGWIELNAKEDPEGAQRFLDIYPAVRFGVMDIGTPSAHGVWMCPTIPRYDIHPETDPELVYNMVKWLDENYDKYKEGHPYCQYMTIDTLLNLAETDYVPLHQGAVKYLEEKGLWTPAHEARRQQQIDLIAKYIEAYADAIDMADEEGIAVDPKNEEWLELWDNYKKQLGLPKFGFFVGLD